ncbi:MAG TPA: hypothetical protein VKU40_16815 [Thermoanaerobaculia bacterium]|nr:hypothetical protein [Thermoanaerobaculia bacterium]
MAERAAAGFTAALVLLLLFTACVSIEPPLPDVSLAAAEEPGGADPRLPAATRRGLFVVGVDFPRGDGGGFETLHSCSTPAPGRPTSTAPPSSV